MPIAADERYAQLAARLAALGAAATLDVLGDLPRHMAAAAPQQGAPTRAPRITRADACVRWRQASGAAVWAQWRALGDSWGVHTYFRKRRVKLVGALSPSSTAALLAGAAPGLAAALAEPGAFCYDRRADALVVRCGDGALLGVATLLVEGHAPVSARQFCVGLKTPVALRPPPPGTAPLRFDDSVDGVDGVDSAP